VIETCLARFAGPFDSRASANARRVLAKMPCRSHCAQQQQAGGIHRHAAETVLHSLQPPCRPAPFLLKMGSLRKSWSETQGLYPISWHRLLNFSRGLATSPVNRESLRGFQTHLGQTVNASQDRGLPCVRYATLELYLIEDIFRSRCSGVFSKWPWGGGGGGPDSHNRGARESGPRSQRELPPVFTQ
jgi:hypothetical protein